MLKVKSFDGQADLRHRRMKPHTTGMCAKAHSHQQLPLATLMVHPTWLGALGPRQGFVLVGPALHFWYQTLGRVVTATGSAGAIQRLMMDQLLFAPFFLSTFLASLLTLEVRALGAGAGPGRGATPAQSLNSVTAPSACR